ncbi:MAG: trypsin-like peptidase domain-containing protein [Opitutales bacterium]
MKVSITRTRKFSLSRLVLPCLLVIGSANAGLGEIERLPEDQRRNGKATLESFSEAAEASLASTVRLVRNGRSLSLGTIVSKQGHVITKASVCIGAQKAILADGTSYPVRIRRRDKETDLALLRIRGAQGLTPVSWAKEDDLEEGSWLVSADPGLKRLKVGVVGAKTRPIDRIGGVIGVILGRDGEGVGGVMIEQVVPRSAGAAAGLKKGDMLVSVETRKVTSREKVIELVGANDPGEVVAIEVKRDDKTLSFRVTLGHRSGTFDMFDRNARMSGAVSKRKDNFPMIIQHDVSLPPTAMGGPVLDLDGKAMGVNVARVDRVTTYALPAKLVRETLEKLRSTKPKSE